MEIRCLQDRFMVCLIQITTEKFVYPCSFVLLAYQLSFRLLFQWVHCFQIVMCFMLLSVQVLCKLSMWAAAGT